MVVKDKFPLGWMLRPEMLAIIVTHHCTSACAGCCFGCSPRVSSSLDEKVMADFIKTCTSLYPEIRVMVLTGGEVLKMKQQKWHDGIAEYDSPSFAWLVPVVAVAFLYVGVATIAAVEVAVAADFALKVTGPSLPTKPEDEVKKRESVLREISENMGLTGEQMAEILDMARKNLQLGIGRHY